MVNIQVVRKECKQCGQSVTYHISDTTRKALGGNVGVREWIEKQFSRVCKGH